MSRHITLDGALAVLWLQNQTGGSMCQRHSRGVQEIIMYSNLSKEQCRGLRLLVTAPCSLT